MPRKILAFVVAIFLAVCASPQKPLKNPRPTVEQTELLYSCWEDKAAYYVGYDEKELCLHPDPIIWKSEQIHVAINLEEPQATLAREALVEWNQILGKEIFVESEILVDLVIVSSPKGFGIALASTMHIKEHKRIASVVTLYPLLTEYQLYDETQQKLVIEHELGHVLGLAHDPEEKDTLMYPGFSPTNKKDLKPTKEDVDLLKKLYAKEQNL